MATQFRFQATPFCGKVQLVDSAVAVAARRFVDAHHHLAVDQAVVGALRRGGGRHQLQVGAGVEREAAHGFAREHRVDVGHVLSEAAAGFGGANVGGELGVDDELQAVHAGRRAADVVHGGVGGHENSRHSIQREQRWKRSARECTRPGQGSHRSTPWPGSTTGTGGNSSIYVLFVSQTLHLRTRITAGKLP
jgi:hypothetical protein